MGLEVDLARARGGGECGTREEGQHRPRQVHGPAPRDEDVGAEVELVSLSCVLQVEEDGVREEFLNHEVAQVRGHDCRAALLVAVVAAQTHSSRLSLNLRSGVRALALVLGVLLILVFVVTWRLKLLEDGPHFVLGREETDTLRAVRESRLEDEPLPVPLLLAFVLLHRVRELVQVVHQQLVQLVRKLHVDRPSLRDSGAEGGLDPTVLSLGEVLGYRRVQLVFPDQRFAVDVA